MDTSFYLPILKSKLGEFTALSKLSPAAKKKIAPLFEVTPLEWDHSEQQKPKTLDDHLMSFCKKFVSKWPTDNCFIDVHLLNWVGIDNTDRIEFIYKLLLSQNYCPAPVIHINSTNAFFEALERTFDVIGLSEIGLRVNLDIVTSENFEREVLNVLEKVSLKPNDTHLIFDLKDSDFSDIENFSEGVLDILGAFPFFNEWKSFTLAGTAFPESTTIKAGFWEFNRNDWEFYRLLNGKLRMKQFDRDINYGDYSIVNPKYFEFDPKKMSSSANIRYTHNKTWVVAKGKALKESKDYQQYKVLAKQIYDKKYLGEGASEGSMHLAKCVRGEVKPGSPNVWMWVGNNHHFTKVLFDLFSILPGS